MRSPPAGGRDSRPSARRRTSGCGGLYLEGNRPLPPPKPIIAKIKVYQQHALGMPKANYKRIKQGITLAIKHILGSTAPFCEHDEAQLRSAVFFLEEWEPRLGSCESGWGTCALLSRALSYRRPCKPRGQRRQRAAASPDAAVASTPAGDGGGGSGDVVPAAGDGGGFDGDVVTGAGTEEQQLAPQQLDLLNQLECTVNRQINRSSRTTKGDRKARVPSNSCNDDGGMHQLP